MAYPTSITTLAANKSDDVDAKSGADLGTSSTTGDHAQHHNDIATEVNAIETELGTNPKGLYAATVRERFEISAYKMQSCRMATTAPLAAVTYANGTAGVGATLTANANGVMAAVDGITPVANDRILVKDQVAGLQNGIYLATSIGAAGAPFVLTRAIDADTATKIADAKILIDTGTLQADCEFLGTATAPTMGTSVLPFRRTFPMHGAGNPRSAWAPGAATLPVVMETTPRSTVGSIWTIPVSATNQYLVGGIVVPAGRTVTNINFVAIVTAGTTTVSWFSLVRQSDRLTMAHTANSTTPPTISVVTTRAMTSAWTPNEDTPIWILVSQVNTVTAMQLPAVAANASVAAMHNITPVMFGQNGVTPTTTVPTDGTTVATAATGGVATSATIGFPYFWLT